MSIPSQILSSGNSPLATIAISGQGAATVAGAGTTIADATQISATYINIASGPASGGVKLPKTEEGAMIIIFNTDSDTQNVFPFDTNSTINGTTSVTLVQNKARIFFAVSATQWFSLLGA